MSDLSHLQPGWHRVTWNDGTLAVYCIKEDSRGGYLWLGPMKLKNAIPEAQSIEPVIILTIGEYNALMGKRVNDQTEQ